MANFSLPSAASPAAAPPTPRASPSPAFLSSLLDFFPSWSASFSSSSSSPGSSSSSSAHDASKLFCRICHEEKRKGREPLISPCRCSGSMGLVHRSCLERWLSTASSGSSSRDAAADTCELCGFRFAVVKRPKPFRQWLLGRPLSDDQRHLVGDLACFLLLTPLAASSGYLCGVGSQYYYNSSRAEAVGLVFLASFLTLVYLLWLVITIKFHHSAWKDWKESNLDVRLAKVTAAPPPPAIIVLEELKVDAGMMERARGGGGNGGLVHSSSAGSSLLELDVEN